jgi:hypothetical protein
MSTSEVKADRKAYFSVERTFLHWVSITAWLGSFSVVFLAVPTHERRFRFVGFALMPSALAGILYALWKVRRRWRALDAEVAHASDFTDLLGPLVLTVMVTCSFAAGILLNI